MKSKLMLFAFTLGVSLSAFAAQTSSTRCVNECSADRNECMAEVANPGGPRPQTCVATYKACMKRCIK